jgi:transposase
VTGNAWEIARILEPHVAQMLVVSSADTGIRQARAKTDRLDARALAKLLAAGSLDGLWLPDEQTRALRRRLGRRAQLVRARTRAKNEVHAVLVRRLIAKPRVADLFGQAGRRWLEGLELPTSSGGCAALSRRGSVARASLRRDADVDRAGQDGVAGAAGTLADHVLERLPDQRRLALRQV